MAGKYVRVGLRRDKNFADLENTYTSLGNLLNNLAPPGKSFIPEDIQVLYDVAEDSNVTNDNFLELKGSTRKATQIRYRTAIEFTSEFESLTFSAGVSIIKNGIEIFFESISNPVAIFDSQTQTYTYNYDAVILTSTDTVPLGLEEVLLVFGTPITITEVNLTQETIDNFIIEPNIRVKDSIDNIKVITGDPPYLAGGDGLFAKFYPSSQIANDAQRIDSISGYELFNYNEAYNGGPPGFYYGPFNFWESGYFGFGPQIYDSVEFINGYGGVQWEGYFSPIPFIVANSIQVVTSGLVMIEEDVNDNDNWQKIVNIHSADRSVNVTSGISTAAIEITLSTQDIIKVGVNDTVKSTTVDGNILGNGIKITSIDYQNNTVRLSDAINLQSGTNEIVFNFGVGVEDITVIGNLIIPGLNTKRKLRISLFWPNETGYISFRKRCSFAYLQESSTQLPSAFFYSTAEAAEPNDNPNSFEFFYKNYINRGNEVLSDFLQVNNQSIIKYSPPLNFSDRITSVSGLGYYGDGLFLNTLIQKGDRVLINKGDSVFLGQVEAASEDQNGFFIPLEDIVNYNSGLPVGDQLVAQETYPYAWKVDVLGLVDVFVRYSNSDSFVSLTGNTNPDRLAKQQIAYSFKKGSGSWVSNGPVILDTITYSTSTNTYNFTVEDYFSGGYSDFLGNTEPPSPTIIFVYKDKSLEDLSKVDFCQGIIGHLIMSESAAGSNTIVLDDVSDVQAGYYIQFKGFIPDGTTISNVNPATNTITLSNAITQTLRADYTITIIPGNPGTENYEICVLPLDTAPPFTGTDTGLRTAAGIENLKTNELLFDNLFLKSAVDEEIGNQVYSKTMDIYWDNGQGLQTKYKILVY